MDEKDPLSELVAISQELGLYDARPRPNPLINAYQELPASINEIDDLIATSPNSTFVEEAKQFRAAFQEGDELVEFCTSKKDWKAGFGSMGFDIKRDGKSVAKLTTIMN